MNRRPWPKACPFPDRCLGSGETCASGSRGPGCVECDTNFFRSKNGDGCEPCDENSTAGMILALVLVVLGLIALLAVAAGSPARFNID